MERLNRSRGSGSVPRSVALLVSFSLVAFGGCVHLKEYVHNGFKVGPNYAPPAVAVAEAWIDTPDPRLVPMPPRLVAWWQVFQDPVLDSLIATASQQNLTLQAAGMRILQARALAGVAKGNLFPQEQELFWQYRRVEQSELSRNRTSAVNHFDQWNLGGSLIWELDFWGKYRRSIESADATFEATIDDYDDALVLLFGEVASTYVEIRTLEQRIHYVQDNVDIQRQAVNLAESKKKAGVRESILDVPQARSNLATTAAAIPQLELEHRQAMNRLCVLLGMPPVRLEPIIGPGAIPFAPPVVAVGIPAELLWRRPDVRAAERRLAAQSAQIGVAKAEMFPSINLEGTYGVDASHFAKLFHQRAWGGFVGPNLRWNILNYGRLVNGVRFEQARFGELLANLQDTVLQANQEAEDAMASFLKSQEQTVILETSVREAIDAVKIATERYELGPTTFNRLFTLQDLRFRQQDRLAIAQGNIAQGLIEIYKSLGGGWEIGPTGYGIHTHAHVPCECCAKSADPPRGVADKPVLRIADDNDPDDNDPDDNDPFEHRVAGRRPQPPRMQGARMQGARMQGARMHPPKQQSNSPARRRVATRSSMGRTDGASAARMVRPVGHAAQQPDRRTTAFSTTSPRRFESRFPAVKPPRKPLASQRPQENASSTPSMPSTVTVMPRGEKLMPTSEAVSDKRGVLDRSPASKD